MVAVSAVVLEIFRFAPRLIAAGLIVCWFANLRGQASHGAASDA